MDAMDSTSMIKKKYSIPDLDLTFFLGLNQIKLNNKEFELTQLFELIF